MVRSMGNESVTKEYSSDKAQRNNGRTRTTKSKSPAETSMKTLPQNDTQAWLMYPKLNWVYSTSTLLDQQKIAWYPFPYEDFTHGLPVFNVEEHSQRPYSNVYIQPLEGEPITTVVALAKGAVKWHMHHDHRGEISQGDHGDLLLRINSFAIMHFKKHTGMVTFETVGNVLTGVRLRHLPHLVEHYPDRFNLAVMTLYRRSQWNL